MVLPMDTSHAQVKTVVRMTYDASNIYIRLFATSPKPTALPGRVPAAGFLLWQERQLHRSGSRQ